MKEFEPKMDSEGPPGSATADACLLQMDTREKTFDWVERGCIPAGQTCTEGEKETAINNPNWLKELKIKDQTFDVQVNVAL